MPSTQAGPGPQIDNPTNLSLSPQEENVLQAMFAGYQRLSIENELGGGLSGGRVLVVRPIKKEHAPQLPAVVKVAPAGLVQREWQAYRDWVHGTLPSTADMIGAPVLPPGNPLGGLRYTLMGEAGTYEIESLDSYCRHASIADIRHVLRDQLFQIVGSHWWLFSEARAAWPLQTSYDFLLPVNLWIEPAALPHGVDPHQLAPDALPSRPLSRDAYVRVEGFVIAEIDPQRQEIALNVPSRADGLPASYRLRLRPVASCDAYQVGCEMPAVEGRIVETRRDRLASIVQDALERLRDGTLGRCADCGSPIAVSRLRAVPTARRCKRCQVGLERKAG